MTGVQTCALPISKESEMLYKALADCSAEKKLVMTGRNDGATGAEYADYIMSKL